MTTDRLERHSLLLLAATLVGHGGNYVYHVICGRLLPASEYGLLMALFGAVNLVLLPMSALSMALTRGVAADLSAHGGHGIAALFRRWSLGMSAAGLAIVAAVWLGSPWLRSAWDLGRTAPLLIAAVIPGLNLFLVLNGAGLQGLQHFRGLALRSCLLFVGRALLVGGCLLLGFRAAGWALLAHVLAMGLALAFGAGLLRRRVSPSTDEGHVPPPLLRQALAAMPVLLSVSALMTADVVLARHLYPAELSGRFAQAATLGRMILWLPLPIAQAMFPKVVQDQQASGNAPHTLRKALAYTLALILGALAVGWVGAPLGLRLLYGIADPVPEQVGWLRGVALAMALLGPAHLLMQYDLARGRLLRPPPLCACALGYVGYALWARPDIPGLVAALQTACLLSLLSLMVVRVRPNRRWG